MQKYGKAGDIYPVKAGEIWRVGPHRFSCFDLVENDIVSALGCSSVDVVYVSPPCNPGRETYDRNQVGLGRSNGWDIFLGQLLQTCMQARLDVWMEGTKQERYAQMVIEAIDITPFEIIEERQCTYYKKNPCLLYRLRRPDMPPLIEIDEIAIDTKDIPHDVLRAYPKGIHVLDPYIGVGRTALAGVQAGHRVFGNDLVPRRLAVTLQKLHKLTGIKPERI